MLVRRVASLKYFRINYRQKLANPKKAYKSFRLSSVYYLRIAFTLSRSILRLSRPTIRPRNLVSNTLNLYLLISIGSPAYRSFSTTIQTQALYSSRVSLYTKQSSIYVDVKSSRNSRSVSLINDQNVDRALQRPKGITRYSNQLY